MSEEVTLASPAPTRYSRYAKVGFCLGVAGLVTFILSISYGVLELIKVNQMLAGAVHHLETDNVKLQEALRGFELITSQIRETSEKDTVRLDEQDKILVDLVATKKEDGDRFAAFQAYNLVRMAHERIMFTADPVAALPLLERAQQLLDARDGKALHSLSATVAQSIQALQTQPKIDTDKLYAQIVSLAKNVQQLKLSGASLQIKATAPNEDFPVDMPWWQKGWHHSVDVLKQIIIVRRNDQFVAPIILPDEKAYFYLALHAQLENLTWSVLHRDQTVFKDSLAATSAWIKAYFVQDDGQTSLVLTQLEELEHISLVQPKIDLSSALTMFDGYLANNHASNTL